MCWCWVWSGWELREEKKVIYSYRVPGTIQEKIEPFLLGINKDRFPIIYYSSTVLFYCLWFHVFFSFHFAILLIVTKMATFHYSTPPPHIFFMYITKGQQGRSLSPLFFPCLCSCLASVLSLFVTNTQHPWTLDLASATFFLIWSTHPFHNFHTTPIPKTNYLYAIYNKRTSWCTRKLIHCSTDKFNLF